MLNAVAGILYSMSLVGLDPNMPDPTMKYWEQEQTPATRAILQFFALASFRVDTWHGSTNFDGWFASLSVPFRGHPCLPLATGRYGSTRVE